MLRSRFLVVMLAVVFIAGCASDPVKKDDRVIVVYPPEGGGSKSPINISYNGTQTNRDGTDVNYNHDDGITYKRPPKREAHVQPEQPSGIMFPQNKYWYDLGVEAGRNSR